MNKDKKNSTNNKGGNMDAFAPNDANQNKTNAKKGGNKGSM